MSFLNDLNDIQKEVVLTTEGPLIVLAGAGSGKTRVLIYRIAYLIYKGIDPFNILSLTFTNKAALEMKNRIGTLIGKLLIKNLWMGTFHSIFSRILRIEANKIGFSSHFTIYDLQDSLNVLKKVIIDLNLDINIYKPKELQQKISYYKNNLITVSNYFNNLEYIEINRIAGKPKVGEIYKAYVEKCFKNSAMDFDDLLVKMNEILIKYPEVLFKYQTYFRYILIDEYQDTNYLQYLIIKKLAIRFQNICVVGDDAQSIYAFRGANIDNILNFQNDYINVKTIVLDQNYRSTQTIVNASRSVINYNKKQFTKQGWTLNPKGEKIYIYQAFSDKDEANFIVNSIIKLKEKNQLKNKEFAILYRTNAQSRILEDFLRKKNLSYQVYGSTSFYLRKEVKDVIAYLRFLINCNDEESLLRIINFPPRGISYITIKKLINFSSENHVSIYILLKDIVNIGSSLGLSESVILKLSMFFQLIESFKHQLKFNEIDKVVMNLVEKTGLLQYFNQEKNSENISKVNNIMELIGSIKSFIEEQKLLILGNPSLEFFLENIILNNENLNNKKQLDNDRISLMTIHFSKGLEFSYVYLPGLEDGLFPSIISYKINEKELEEERRLFYVALTRARIQIIISFAIKRFMWGKFYDNQPSRFLKEIKKEYLQYLNYDNQYVSNNSELEISEDLNIFQDNKNISLRSNCVKLKSFSEFKLRNMKILNIVPKIGASVKHHYFGDGIIISIEDNDINKIALINFNNFGEKKILLEFVKLNNY